MHGVPIIIASHIVAEAPSIADETTQTFNRSDIALIRLAFDF